MLNYKPSSRYNYGMCRNTVHHARVKLPPLPPAFALTSHAWAGFHYNSANETSMLTVSECKMNS